MGGHLPEIENDKMKEPSEDLNKYVISENSTILQAMQAINDNWREMVLVDDAKGRIQGIITDGDIRRGLLKGLTLDSPIDQIVNHTFFSVGPNDKRADVLDIMMSRNIRAVPTLSENGRLLGIHFLRDLIGGRKRPNVAVIMAGGKGVRLRPLTNSCPKPMIEVAGRPIIERLILHLLSHGFKKIFISINYLGEMIENRFGDGSNFGCSIQYLKEDMPLGTGGALSLLPAGINKPILVMNGDQITQADLGKLMDAHVEGDFKVTIGVKLHQVQIPFGVIEQKDNRYINMREKPSANFLVNAGIYVFDPSIVKFIPKGKEFPITDLFNALKEKQLHIGVHYIEEDWIDIGRHDELKKARGLN